RCRASPPRTPGRAARERGPAPGTPRPPVRGCATAHLPSGPGACGAPSTRTAGPWQSRGLETRPQSCPAPPEHFGGLHGCSPCLLLAVGVSVFIMSIMSLLPNLRKFTIFPKLCSVVCTSHHQGKERRSNDAGTGPRAPGCRAHSADRGHGRRVDG